MRKWWKRGKTWREKTCQTCFAAPRGYAVDVAEVCPLIVLSRLTVSSLLASMSRPVIDLTIDLTKADSPSDSDYPGAMVDRGSSSDSCIVISDDGMR